MDKVKGKILIVDDDARLLKAYNVKLGKEGFTVVTERDGANALDRVKKERPDIVLLDVLMPHKTGWDILNDMKSDDKLKDIPVILVSNIGNEEKEIQALDAGAAGYLVKSNTTLEVLMQKIHNVLSIPRE